MKKQFGDYYIGLDIGTSSIGWAVTDLHYKVLKFNGKSMWGVRLFDEAKTAEERRKFRSARRRNDRSKQRIKLLQEIFAEEIAKVDFGFFMRLNDSKLYVDDKTEKTPYAFFGDPDYTDKEFHREYPTIYHLRYALTNSREAKDIRLVYLAIHHILKHRGHFLYAGDFKDVSALEINPMLEELAEVTEEILGFGFSCTDIESCKRLLTDQTMSITAKKKEMNEIFEYQEDFSKQAKAMIALMSKGTAKLHDIFGDDSLKEEEKNSVTFNGTSFDENESIYRSVLQERFAVIEKLKALYDWGVLQYVLSGEKSISVAKVKSYEMHHEELVMLKAAVREYCPQKYKAVFGRPAKDKANYSAYVGLCDINGKKHVIEKRCTQEAFCQFLKKEIFNGIEIDEASYPKLQEKIDSGTLLTKQKIKDNGVIPYQVHKQELEKILENAAAYLPFLEEKDEDGYTAREKILSIMTYRIPYYVGPVNSAHDKGEKGFYWAVRKDDKLSEPVRPWNFDQIIDREKSAERFIRRMTNKCTYLHCEDVLPKDSLLYSKYMVLNELNNLKIDGEKIPVSLKQEIYQELFLKRKKVTQKKLKKYLEGKGLGHDKDIEISGIDGDFKASMTAYLDFRQILGKDAFSDWEKDMIDDIIKYIVLFGEDKKLLKSKIRNLYGEKLTDEQMSEILKKKYNGWGRLSAKLLTGIYMVEPSTGEYLSILSMLYNAPENPNLQQLLSNDYQFSKIIEQENSLKEDDGKIDYEAVKELYASVPVKRAIWQTVCIVKELTKILGHEPRKVFIEMARGKEPQKGRTKSRKDQLLELYEACKREAPLLYEALLYEALNQTPDDKLKSDKLYLYYTQMGRCMYTGQRIELDSLNDYDIDHIWPQSKTMDDSLDNRVLVLKTENAKKGDKYPISESIRKDRGNFWKTLRHIGDKGMISQTKLDRLLRNTEFSDGELVGFVSRQLVETRQSTKAVAQLLDKMFDRTEIVYVKAGIVSEFRRGVDDYDNQWRKHADGERREQNRFIKCRAVNDYHHAKDAYLNIVVGNVFHCKFTHNPYNFFRNKEAKYSFNAMYKFPVVRNGITAWEPTTEDKEGTMAVVRKQIAKNDILYTRYAKEGKGGLFKQTILKKGKGQVPIKGNGAISSIEKYGGYDSASSAYFFIAEHEVKGKKVRTIETMLAYKKNEIIDKDDLLKYCRDFLGLKEPRILLEKVKVDALLEINGFRMHITGKTGNRYVVRNAMQLIVDGRSMTYIKKVDSFITRKKSNKAVRLTAFDGIDEDSNLRLYDLFTDKLKNSIYRMKLSEQAATMEKGRERFAALEMEEQCAVLMQILNFFRCDRTLSDLRLIGGSRYAGSLAISKDITKYDEIYIINQSSTGLFEQKIKIREL